MEYRTKTIGISKELVEYVIKDNEKIIGAFRPATLVGMQDNLLSTEVRNDESYSDDVSYATFLISLSRLYFNSTGDEETKKALLKD